MIEYTFSGSFLSRIIHRLQQVIHSIFTALSDREEGLALAKAEDGAKLVLARA
jgi:hypothetical protein